MSDATDLLSLSSQPNVDEEIELDHTIDLFEGVQINCRKLPAESEFDLRLGRSLSRWKALDRKGVWLFLSIEQSQYIPIAAKHGFQFHHSKPEMVVMTKWLPEDIPNKIPTYGGFFVGVGSFVYDEKTDRILVVLEKYSNEKGAWKIPTGTVEVGERLVDSVKRELLEETAIVAEPIGLLGITASHPFQFDISSLLFVFLMQPSSFDIQKEDFEILECKWVDPRELITDPNVLTWTKALIARAYRAFTGRSLDFTASCANECPDQQLDLEDSWQLEFPARGDDPSLFLNYRLPTKRIFTDFFVSK